MSRFNPFKRVDSKYGAPMGRHGHDNIIANEYEFTEDGTIA